MAEQAEELAQIVRTLVPDEDTEDAAEDSLTKEVENESEREKGEEDSTDERS